MRTLSEEHKARMKAGRERYAEERKAKKAKDAASAASPSVHDVPKRLVAQRELPEFAGINDEDCPIDCTMEKCCITGAGICGHPKKCGLQAAYKANPEIMARYNRARRVLAHAELDRKP